MQNAKTIKTVEMEGRLQRALGSRFEAIPCDVHDPGLSVWDVAPHPLRSDAAENAPAVATTPSEHVSSVLQEVDGCERLGGI